VVAVSSHDRIDVEELAHWSSWNQRRAASDTARHVKANEEYAGSVFPIRG
jgi:hypothetical protein